ncbi:hypothetical protein SMAC4_13579 [Sordaria macrospora]|uniref:uncharacterized protein n=1 Tax=Sordaria macrospora TaxID=5147 RepID=UPI002B2CA6B3|nr:hypothetical protein SMAC4_13579 [Sordaria macrospora]
MNCACPKVFDIGPVWRVKAGYHVGKDFGQPENPRVQLLVAKGLEPGQTPENVGPEHYSGYVSVVGRRGGEIRQKGVGDVGVHEALLHHGRQLSGKITTVYSPSARAITSKIDRVNVNRIGHGNEVLLTFMGNQEMTERLGVLVDEETKLGENSEPHIVGADPQVQVLLPGANDGMYEAILVAHNGELGVRRSFRIALRAER